jgi:hypothetical protein
MTAVHVVGGRQRTDAAQREAWHLHDRALVARIDLDTGEGRVAYEWITPPELCAPSDPSISFSAATREGDRLWMCTKTEVLVRSFPDYRDLGGFSLPCFHDLHHVAPAPDGTVLVVDTGLDAVVRCSAAGELLELWNVVGEPGWGKFDPSEDYRRVDTTKPHAAHPNYVFHLEGQPWVTRFQQRDAVRVGNVADRLPVGVERCHDGIVHDGRVWFTTVDAHLVVLDPATRMVEQVHDLAQIAGDLRKPGWCRGLAFLPGGDVVVGFSRLRLTKWSDHLGWLKGGLRALKALAHRPARIARFDLQRRRLVWERELEDVELGTVFSLHIEP